MVDPDKISGRLGNKMFQIAFLYRVARDNDIDIFFQNELYFKKYEREIRSLFGQDIPPMTNKVSIHIRRGDYVTPPQNAYFINLCKTDYYERAMALFPGEEFLVFSDDIPFAKTFLIGSQFSFSEGRSEVEDLNLMASCKHNIGANSTFSWWASWLNPNKDKKVVSPKRWSLYPVEPTIVPDTWIRL